MRARWPQCHHRDTGPRLDHVSRRLRTRVGIRLVAWGLGDPNALHAEVVVDLFAGELLRPVRMDAVNCLALEVAVDLVDDALHRGQSLLDVLGLQETREVQHTPSTWTLSFRREAQFPSAPPEPSSLEEKP